MPIVARITMAGAVLLADYVCFFVFLSVWIVPHMILVLFHRKMVPSWAQVLGQQRAEDGIVKNIELGAEFIDENVERIAGQHEATMTRRYKRLAARDQHGA